MKSYIYCDKRSLNDATNYYVGIIKDCLKKKGSICLVVHKLSEINNPDLIVTITEKYFLFSKLRYPFVQTIYWAQGVDAEEVKMQPWSIKNSLRYYLRYFAESLAVNYSTLLFCVSKRMVEYFRDTYGYKDKGNCIVMPCYNLHISENFDVKQYLRPTFVYAGGCSVWQSVDFMLDVYARVEKEIKSSRLVICTKDFKEFENKIKTRNIVNYEIKYIPVNELQEELHKYKYGLIIREDHIVNNVSTPTKMNSYLANYLIPIFSDAVDDFNRNIKLGEFTIMAKCPLDATKIACQIIEFENSIKDYSLYKSIVEDIFLSHYNDIKYIDAINNKIESFICR